MSQDEQPTSQPQINDADKAAVDQVFEQGFDPASSDAGHTAHLRRLLDVLNAPVSEEKYRENRIDLIELLAQRAQAENPAGGVLGTTDIDAVDAFVEYGYDASAVPAELQGKAQRLESIGALLTSGAESGVVDRDDLIISTLGRVQSHIDEERAAMSIQGQRGFQLPARWADLVSIAAMFLLAASVIMPIMSGLRSTNQRAICFNNLNETANAFGLYTNANRDMLPMATAGFGPTWMDVGTTPERSNSSNLYTLVRNNFAGLNDLACPTNPNAAIGDADPDAWDWDSLDEISYSYRIMPRGGMRATVPEQPVRVVLLADRSPVILRVKRNQPVIPEENSPNHSGRGQHMLMLDGSARWAETPVIDSRDNMWLPRPIETLIHNERARLGIISGNEQPDGPTDAFVGP